MSEIIILHYSSEIILIYGFAALETFLSVIINDELNCESFFKDSLMNSSKEEHLFDIKINFLNVFTQFMAPLLNFFFRFSIYLFIYLELYKKHSRYTYAKLFKKHFDWTVG